MGQPHNLRVVARYARVGDDEVFINLATHAERRAVEHDIFLIVALDKHQRGKHTGTRTVVTDGTQGHEMSDRRAHPAFFAFVGMGCACLA